MPNQWHTANWRKQRHARTTKRKTNKANAVHKSYVRFSNQFGRRTFAPFLTFFLHIWRTQKFATEKTHLYACTSQHCTKIPQSNRKVIRQIEAKTTTTPKKIISNVNHWQQSCAKWEKVALYFNLKKMMFDRKPTNVQINQRFYDNYKLLRIMALVTWISSFHFSFSSKTIGLGCHSPLHTVGSCECDVMCKTHVFLLVVCKRTCVCIMCCCRLECRLKRLFTILLTTLKCNVDFNICGEIKFLGNFPQCTCNCHPSTLWQKFELFCINACKLCYWNFR